MRTSAAAPAVQRPATTASRRHFLTLHGQRLAYLEAGQGPPLLLIHGIAEAAWAWEVIIPALARRHRVIAPDLLGHGRSAKPRGDYSLGNQATLMRDLMISLDIEHATLVGHSLGGGITMQFAYQYPERCERMVLVASGGLGQDVTFLLRSLGLPGADLVAPLFLSNTTRDLMQGAARWLGRRGLKASPGQKAMWRSYAGLTEPATRAAFIATVRAVIDQRGQRVSALERLYLAESMPTLLVWGEKDRDHPGQPRSQRPRGDAGQPARGHQRRRPLRAAGTTAARRRADPRLPRHHQAGAHHRRGHARRDAQRTAPSTR